MVRREELEKREREWLAPYAVQSGDTQGRSYPEKEHAYRTVYQRDKDRIIFSAAFRRLQYKTQVFSNFEGDHYRTRLTHTLEVSQIARSLARSLRLNEDLCEAIALAHDLGHGPFGHIGEEILNTCMREHGGFEHNAQSLRVVEELEDIYERGVGLNLTWETKEGLKKHTYREEGARLPLSFTTLEAQVVDLADEIAYDSHDIDDGLGAGLFTEQDVLSIPLWKELAQRVADEYPQVNTYQRVRLMIRSLINEQVTDVLMTSEQQIREAHIRSRNDVVAASHALIDFSRRMKAHKNDIKFFLKVNFYRNPQVMQIVDLAKECIVGLFDLFVSQPQLLPQHFYSRVQNARSPQRVVCDYIAGMTDRYAYDEYQRLRGSSSL